MCNLERSKLNIDEKYIYKSQIGTNSGVFFTFPCWSEN